jgi:uroporphyrinogen-III decarboxylase
MGALVRLHICGNTRRIVAPMASLGADIVDLDYPVDLAAARAAAGPAQVLLGNLDPVAGVMQATAEAVTSGLGACHRAAGNRWIVGAGCEIPSATPMANVDALAAYAQSTAP